MTSQGTTLLHDIEAERATLGAALVDSEAMKKATEILSPHDFYSEAHRVIFLSCLRLLNEGSAADLVTVTGRLRNTGKLAAVGGPVAVSSLLDDAPDVGNIAFYCNSVKEKAARREAVAKARRAIDFAEEGKPLEGVRGALRDGLEALAEPSNTVGVRLSDVEAESVEWLWGGRIPYGKITVLDGDPGLGKSTLTLDLAARLTKGRGIPFDSSAPIAGGVVLLSAEDGAADTIRPRFDAAGGDPSKVIILQTLGEGTNRRPVSLPEDLGILKGAIKSVEARLVVVDPLMAFLGGDVNSHRDQDVRRALFALADLAERTDVALVVVRHLNKTTGGNPLYRGGGSIGIIGAARAGLVVAADPQDAKKRIIAQTKSNLGRPERAIRFELEDGGTGVASIWWREETDLSADEILSPPERRRDISKADAEDFLETILENGAVSATRIHEEAEARGISERTLKRAKKSMNIASFNVGKAWSWELPGGRVPTPPVIGTVGTLPRQAEGESPKTPINIEGCQRGPTLATMPTAEEGANSGETVGPLDSDEEEDDDYEDF